MENTKLGESQKLDNILSDSDGETNDCFNFTNNIPDLHFAGDNNKEIEPDNELEEEFDDVLDRPMTEEELNDFEIELYSETSSGVVSQETDFFSNNYWRIPAAASQLEDLDWQSLLRIFKYKMQNKAPNATNGPCPGHSAFYFAETDTVITSEFDSGNMQYAEYHPVD